MSAKLKHLDPLLLGSALLAGFLNGYGIWQDQYANAYYTAAVTSMLQSFHNFFFASFDPGGFVTVDKPPVAFWLQTLFAALFGVHGWSVILPQALAGIGSVLLVYFLVKPAFGRRAARVSALVMASTPIAAAVSRTNNVDSLLVFTLLLATWMLFRAVKTNRLRWFIASFGLVGLGFNIKMLQAYMVLPAFYGFYWLAFKAGWKRKLGILAASTASLLVITFSWAVIVDSIPAADRPYIGSSQTNSVLELAFGYNGLSRLTGQRGLRDGGRGDFLSGQLPGQLQLFGGGTPGDRPGRQNSGQGLGSLRNNSYLNVPFSGNSLTARRGDVRPGGGPGGGMFNTGKAGPFRLFQSQLSGQISWLLPFSLVSAIALLLGLRRKQPLTDKQRESLFWLAWLLPMMGFFSIAEFFHPYYLIMLAPAIAALTGAGWAEMWGFCRDRNGGWKGWLLPIGLLATTLFQLYILLPYSKQIGSAWPIALGALGSVFSVYLALSLLKNKHADAGVPLEKTRLIRAAAFGGLAILLAAPLYWAATPLLYGGNSTMPEAGPQLNFGKRGSLTGQRETINTELLAYLQAQNTGEKFLFATTNAGTAEAYIIKTGKAVMAMGGFSGSDPILTVAKLKQMVADKEIKYFLLSGGSPRGGSSDVQTWIRQNGKEVPQADWQSGTGNAVRGNRGMNGAGTLYEMNP
ncbi:glycosyltransferase family 39 protein [Desulfosporosinus sp. PR]|uniref:glycosyltransferase family 39 protein n=1 Tax=Candidatus Desulfosporosinus nitrosoreducens TaxID=3401928 RepID=UPI0027EFC326|nr:glycosyltransferase family 39 protein [Desulfosporosinus sp. PR]MDQ7095611.1 glycosyltransferase family 39 protein [Desulfosporosinus sp. PR]